MSWGVGQQTIDLLLEKGELQRVPADSDLARALIETSRHHLASAESICELDPEGACQLGYDAARKACSAILQAQGLRSTTSGGHIAVRDAVEAQFATLTGGGVVRGLDRIRRRRHDLEYPDIATPIGAEDVQDALRVATEIVDFADRLVDVLPVY